MYKIFHEITCMRMRVKVSSCSHAHQSSRATVHVGIRFATPPCSFTHAEVCCAMRAEMLLDLPT